MKPLLATLAALACSLPSTSQAATSGQADAIRARLADPEGGLIVVAHRGCHAPAPHHGLSAAPENSRLALEHCVALGVDVMEADVLRSADGHLVIIHDDTVDRTTDGAGRVAQMTLTQLKALRLRDDLGGPGAPLTEERILTLEELLAAAKGRILLNLDVKAAVYVETIDAVIRAGAQKDVIVKAEAGVASPPLAGMSPYDQVPFMPILINAAGAADLAAIARRQTDGVRPIGVELPRMTEDQLPALAELARARKVRLMINTLGEGFVPHRGDIDALRSGEDVWGTLEKAGVSIFQTDEPEALMRFRRSIQRER